MKTKMHSFRDSKNKLWVACSECERGGNGTDIDKCSCGWNVKRFNGLGCFLGILLKKFNHLIKGKEDKNGNNS